MRAQPCRRADSVGNLDDCDWPQRWASPATSFLRKCSRPGTSILHLAVAAAAPPFTYCMLLDSSFCICCYRVGLRFRLLVDRYCCCCCHRQLQLRGLTMSDDYDICVSCNAAIPENSVFVTCSSCDNCYHTGTCSGKKEDRWKPVQLEMQSMCAFWRAKR